MSGNLNPKRLSKRKATRIFRDAAQDSSRVYVTVHAESRMEDRDITLTQILKVLRTGTIYDGPEDNPLYDNWECGVKGFSAGENIRLRVGIERDEKDITIITVFKVG